MQPFEALDRHEKIALQFSGGKDSLACLYLLKPYWDKITVYWLNAGDAFPETVSLIEKVKTMVPSFVEIKSDVRKVQELYGIPSDIVPESGTPFGRMVGHDTPLIQGRYSCCFATIMRPMHERMMQDWITLVIRGQRADDRLHGPIKSGSKIDGIEFLFPIEDWSQRDVLRYLEEQGAPIPRFYEVMNTSPDCMSCSAWWEDGRALYLKRYHHDAYREYQSRLDRINVAVSQHIAHFNTEVKP